MLLWVCLGTDVNATDVKGVTPLHLALSRLRLMGEKQGKREEEGGGGEVTGEVPTFRKKEIMQVSSLKPATSIRWLFTSAFV